MPAENNSSIADELTNKTTDELKEIRKKQLEEAKNRLADLEKPTTKVVATPVPAPTIDTPNTHIQNHISTDPVIHSDLLPQQDTASLASPAPTEQHEAPPVDPEPIPTESLAHLEIAPLEQPVAGEVVNNDDMPAQEAEEAEGREYALPDDIENEQEIDSYVLGDNDNDEEAILSEDLEQQSVADEKTDKADPKDENPPTSTASQVQEKSEINPHDSNLPELDSAATLTNTTEETELEFKVINPYSSSSVSADNTGIISSEMSQPVISTENNLNFDDSKNSNYLADPSSPKGKLSDDEIKETKLEAEHRETPVFTIIPTDSKEITIEVAPTNEVKENKTINSDNIEELQPTVDKFKPAEENGSTPVASTDTGLGTPPQTPVATSVVSSDTDDTLPSDLSSLGQLQEQRQEEYKTSPLSGSFDQYEEQEIKRPKSETPETEEPWKKFTKKEEEGENMRLTNEASDHHQNETYEGEDPNTQPGLPSEGETDTPYHPTPSAPSAEGEPDAPYPLPSAPQPDAPGDNTPTYLSYAGQKNEVTDTYDHQMAVDDFLNYAKEHSKAPMELTVQVAGDWTKNKDAMNQLIDSGAEVTPAEGENCHFDDETQERLEVADELRNSLKDTGQKVSAEKFQNLLEEKLRARKLQGNTSPGSTDAEDDDENEDSILFTSTSDAPHPKTKIPTNTNDDPDFKEKSTDDDPDPDFKKESDAKKSKKFEAKTFKVKDYDNNHEKTVSACIEHAQKSGKPLTELCATVNGAWKGKDVEIEKLIKSGIAVDFGKDFKPSEKLVKLNQAAQDVRDLIKNGHGTPGKTFEQMLDERMKAPSAVLPEEKKSPHAHGHSSPPSGIPLRKLPFNVPTKKLAQVLEEKEAPKLM